MSSLAILIISTVFINTVGNVILACIDAKNCSSKTRNEKRISKTNNKQKDKEKK